jgi:hypothetical protein
VKHPDPVTDEEGRVDWSRTLTPCAHGCIMGKPDGMAPNGGCRHMALSLRETQALLHLVAMDRRALRAEVADWRAKGGAR